MKKFRSIHPFLFSVFPVLALFTSNIGELAGNALRVLPVHILLAILFAGVVFLFMWLITGRDMLRASIMSTLLIFTFFSYGYFFDTLAYFFDDGFVRHRFILPIVVTLVFWGVFWIWKTNRSLEECNRFLSVAGGVLFLIPFMTMVGFFWQGGLPNDSMLADFNIPNDQFSLQASIQKQPDIYYIILDGYASNVVLESFFGYPNTKFSDFLKDRGFFTADNSMSNYGYTYASLASSLNMSYIDNLAEKMGKTSDNLQPLLYLIENNQVVRILQDLGYSYTHLSSGYPMTNFNRHADVSFRQGLGRFSLFLLQGTVMRPFIDPTSPWRIGFSKEDEIRKRILYQIATLKSIPDSKNIHTPRFVFAHLVSPHQPYVFDKDGNPVPDSHKSNPEVALKGYKEQLMYLNKLIMEAVEVIQDRSDIPPVIIIQSDHGTNPPTVQNPRIKFHNFIAIHPGENDNIVLNDDITPVNIFRTIFNGYFGSGLPILENRVYAVTQGGNYNFTDVTASVLNQKNEMVIQ